MLVKNTVLLTLVAGDVSKAPARLAASTQTPRDDREGAKTPTIVDLPRGSPRAQASAEKELNLQIGYPGEGHSSAVEILGEGGGEGTGGSDREHSGWEPGMEGVE